MAGNFPRMYGSSPINVYIGGQRFGGWYEVDGREVLVSSAYGSKRAPKGRGDPAKVASKVLEELVAARPRPH
jgi:hypothetical protein